MQTFEHKYVCLNDNQKDPTYAFAVDAALVLLSDASGETDNLIDMIREAKKAKIISILGMLAFIEKENLLQKFLSESEAVSSLESPP